MWYDTKIPETVPRPPHLPLQGVGILFPGPNATPLRRRSDDRDGIDETTTTKEEQTGGSTGGGGGGGGGGGVASQSRPPPPTHLVVLDTTWHRARRMYNRIPWVRELPAYVLGGGRLFTHTRFRST